MPSLETNQLLAVAVDAADSRKAEDIRILALDPTESALTDYFLICNGTNERQNAAIADEIEGRLKREFGIYPNSTEGRRQGEWILMDYVDFVVHIFMPEKREYYGLERLRKTATTMSAADLNAEINKAITATRKRIPRKRPLRRAPKKSPPQRCQRRSLPQRRPRPRKRQSRSRVARPAARPVRRLPLPLQTRRPRRNCRRRSPPRRKPPPRRPRRNAT